MSEEQNWFASAVIALVITTCVYVLMGSPPINNARDEPASHFNKLERL